MSNIPYQNKLSPAIQTEQDHFLKHLIEQNIPVLIYLKIGIRLTGFIIGYDDYVILFRSNVENNNPVLQLIYKQAISTIVSDCLLPGQSNSII